MPAVTSAEQHNPKLHGSSKRQPPPGLAPWHAGLRAPLQATAPSGASRQACHAGGRAGRATQSRTVREFQSPSAAKTGGVARTPARSTSSRRAQWSKPPGLPCRRSRRQSNTIPSCAGGPTPSAAKTGGVARRTARSTSARGPQDCALHLKPPPQVEQAARLAMPAVAPAEEHNPGLYGSSHAFRRQDWRRGTQDCALHLNPPPQSGASRQACHAGGRAGRVTQSRVAREFQRHPPPRLAPWHARLRAPPQVARLLIGRYAGIRSIARLLRSARQ